MTRAASNPELQDFQVNNAASISKLTKIISDQAVINEKAALEAATTAGLEAESAQIEKDLAERNSSDPIIVDDFILRPGKPLLKFNKDDLIMGGTNLDGASKEPPQPSMVSSVLSSISTAFNKLDNSNSRVSNDPLPQSNEDLKKELQELKEIMSGFVNQMAQVVDRPITIELDGNKVGQALGQNSYRMQ
jgi:hypothetical protein